ncbi:hypothetical protein CWE22_05350 [Pseudidiomarina aestuarii]|uniref:Uncharacterized protein n=1 Tax=Pseudidiomarina aestuarii TaxID=624146 RepID=A0A7Z7ETZ3_9GAMM|nr:FG-GAP-like repeat-containing protein [Pseudidiomarina aestuarii]RUO41587.1 hypothetical protein CWE22_05350 [Pseudidiomarina aestuarii]
MISSMRVGFTALVIFACFTAVPAFADVKVWKLSKNQDEVKHVNKLVEQLNAPSNRLARVKNQYFVELNTAELKLVQRGDQLTVPLPNGVQNLVVTKRQVNSSGTQSLTARVKNSSESGFVIITLGKQTFHITAQASGRTYTGRGEESVGILVAESDYQQLLPGVELDEIAITDSPSQIELEKYLPLTSASGDIFTSHELDQQSADETVIIDVLFYFTPEVRELLNNEPQSRIDHLITVTNFIFSQSRTNTQIRGRSIEVDYSGITTQDGLSDMFQKRNGFENIVDDRFLNGADTVVLLLPINLSEVRCSAGYTRNPLVRYAADYALSAMGYDCGDRAVAHGLGHNLGLMHSRDEQQIGAAFEFGVGYGVDDEFYTTMASARFFYTGIREPDYKFIFSTPDLYCGTNLPCGIAEGEPDSADATKAIRLVADRVASFYDENPDTTLATDAIAQVADPNLRNCLIENESSNQSQYAAGWQFLDCYAFRIADLSGLESFKNLRIFTAYVSEDIDLSALSGMNNLEFLYLSPTREKLGQITLTNLDALAGLTSLSSLTLEYFGITDISFLTNMKQLVSVVLRGNPIENFDPIFSLYNLQILDLASTNFPSSLVGNFRDMTELFQLILSQNNMTEIVAAEFPSSLENLDLSENQLLEVPNIDSAEQLRELLLTSNPLINIDNLANAVSLRTLSLVGANIDDISVLSRLNQLRALSIVHTKVSNIEVVRKFTELNRIVVSHTPVSDISPALIHLSDDVSPSFLRDYFGFDSLVIPCWQKAYGEALRSDVKTVSFNNTSCITDEDYSDHDGDGIANIVEVNFGLNPLSSDSNGDGIDDTLASSISLDADGDGKADLFVRNTDTFFNYGFASENSDIQRVVLGKNSKDIPVFGDFDGDGRTDIGVRRPSTSMWYVKSSSTPGTRGDFIQRIKFGLAPEDIPVLADYDGDGITDFAVYRPSNHIWYIKPSSGGDIMEMSVGANDGDIPVTGDFDGDGKADIAIRRPSTHTWHILRSSDGQEQVISFGLAEEDIPVPADYDGDGITDLAVRRPSTQMWYILNSSGEPGPYGDGIQRIKFGLDPADIPIVDDYDGDGKADIAVRRPSTQMQYILTSSGEGGDRGDGIMRVRFGLQEKYVPFQAPIHIRMQMVEAANER